MNQLDQLKAFTTVVADTGDFQLLAQYQPVDATTNPSLVLKTVQKPQYQHLLRDTVVAHRGQAPDWMADQLLVRMGCEILALIPGRVSTEVDARLSYDRNATLARARRLISLYEERGIDRQRILIKIASTWEGIQAASVLEKEGIHTNLTLLFAPIQALACAEAGVRLISPFVGRIYDWYKKQAGANWDEAAHAGANDPGVKSVREIFQYYKHFGISTQVMGASFRNTGQILALAGCDFLTISPELLQTLQSCHDPLPQALDADLAAQCKLERQPCDETTFRTAMQANIMAQEKLDEGIRAFAADNEKLEQLLTQTALGS